LFAKPANIQPRSEVVEEGNRPEPTAKKRIRIGHEYSDAVNIASTSHAAGGAKWFSGDLSVPDAARP